MSWTRCGKIKGIDLSRFEVHPAGMIRNSKTGRMLRGELHGKGFYPTLSIQVRGKRKRFRIHKILLETFRPRPLPSLQVDHRNSKHSDFALKNLRWVSSLLNISFWNTQGWSRKGKQFEARFQNKVLGRFDSPEKAKQAHVDAKTQWQRIEMNSIIDNVAKTHGLDNSQAKRALNWIS